MKMAVNFRLKKPSTEYRSIPVSFRLKAGICLFLTLCGMFLCMEHILLSQTEPKTMFLLAGLLLIGLGCAPVYPSIIHSTPEHFGAARSQAMIGVQMASAYAGTCLMPPLFGLLANYVSVSLFPV